VNDLLADFTGLITDHRAWAGPLVGLIVFGESLAVIGMFFPATPIMFAIGGMMASGTVDPFPVGLWALGGAVLGDWLSYSLGRSAGHKIYYRAPFNRHQRTFARARLFFRRYGFMSIFLGRFMGPVRATVPLVSGVVRMKRSSFHAANILSALAWVPASFAPGYLALGGLGTARLVTQSQLVAIGGVIALLTIVIAILAPIVSLRRRSRRR
jgi:membrane protein DedA with SNARE-associated domain